MKTEINYNVCRDNLGDDTTDAQYGAFKKLVESALVLAFPDAEITVGDSDFSNASTCVINTLGSYEDGDLIISRDDVEEVASNVGESWWDAK